MTPKMRWKVLLVLVVVIFAGWRSSYTFRFLSMTDKELAEMPRDEAAQLEANAIRLGLDLQGGMHVVLEVDNEGVSAEQARQNMDRAQTTIRNRVDQFGVAEPSVQIEGSNRIIVQLPGLQDEQRAKRLIGRTALLEFVPVAGVGETDEAIMAIDEALAGQSPAGGETDDGEAVEEPDAAPVEGLLEEDANAALAEDEELASEIERIEREHPLMSRIVPLESYSQSPIRFVPESEVAEVKRQLASIDMAKVLPGPPGRAQKSRYRVAWDAETRQLTEDPERFRAFYVLESDTIMTGAQLATADVRRGLSEEYPNTPGLSLTFTSQGSREFADHTAAHIGEYIAILLDGVVHSAAVIQSRIPVGRPASLTGRFTDQEANDIAIVLQAGRIPAPMSVEYEYTVGPSLGRDSINLGIRAMLFGGILVVLFMLIYYRAAGAVAVAALVVNVLLVIALMASLPVNPRPALTLPGLAGIILTIGMAVDANVLIFERIREELRNQKTIRAAIRDGYERAFTTIMDANVTTLIAAAVLLYFGTGPVKGFGVTLSLGIIASMFTAVVATRVVFDLITSHWNVKHLSI